MPERVYLEKIWRFIWRTFMHEIHLRQSEFTYSACAWFTNNKEKVRKNT